MRLITTLALAISAVTAFDCLVPELDKYNLEILKGVHSVSQIKDTPPLETNQTWYVGVCTLIDGIDECPKNLDVCGITRVSTKEAKLTTNIILFNTNVAKSYLLVDGDEEKGVAVSYKGVNWGDSLVDAELQFICDKNTNDGKLEVVSWDGTKVTMKLKSKGACITSKEDKKKPADDKPKDNGELWGWFTWIFIFMVLFLSIYIIGGAWFQYNKGNAIDFQSALREVLENFVDLLRGLPGFIREILQRFTGNSNRGEYSAV